MQGLVAGVDIERFAEFVDIRIAVGKLLARQLGCACFTAARGGKQRLHHALGVTPRPLHAGEIEQYGLPLGLKLERRLVTRGREVEFIALFGQLGQFVKRAEGGGRGCQEPVAIARYRRRAERRYSGTPGMQWRSKPRHPNPVHGQRYGGLRLCGRARYRGLRSRERRIRGRDADRTGRLDVSHRAAWLRRTVRGRPRCHRSSVRYRQDFCGCRRVPARAPRHFQRTKWLYRSRESAENRTLWRAVRTRDPFVPEPARRRQSGRALQVESASPAGSSGKAGENSQKILSRFDGRRVRSGSADLR